ncbi:hypothetical protein K0J45_12130 [Shewanella alkalitolerans]|uniref:hypothetical protein n=1 Tax=Shewanella alkalitolerans TaxID=2864209 RepID=UPI001C65F4AB|nr:hypothetical protein [Shewanella alkalitolerans]QYJ96296.1 hypothetical protein K0J45_12130 [Shewanella alkalitolerans]
MVKMGATKQLMLQVILIMLITILLLVISYPAFTVANARFRLKTDIESGATLAERYLILGDWPSGNEDNLLSYFNGFQVKTDAAPNDSTLKLRETSNTLPVKDQTVIPQQPR